MARGDRGLQAVGAERAVAGLAGAVERGEPAADRVAVPQRAVLVEQRDERPVRAGARRQPRDLQLQQREQPERLGVVGDQLGDQAREPQRLAAQVGRMSASPPVATWPSLKTR